MVRVGLFYGGNALSGANLANDVGSVLYGEDAVALGLMQQVGTLKDALAALYRAIDEDKKQRNTN